MLETYQTSSIEWKPSPVISLATAVDSSQIAAARDDGSLEIWRVSPGSTTWHCQFTIQGDPKRRVSSLVWCHWKGLSPGRLFSASIDGLVSEWDLFNLKQKVVLNSNGVSIWQMAVAPFNKPESRHTKQGSQHTKNGYLKNNANDDDDFSDSEAESVVLNDDIDSDTSNHHIAMACDNGCIQVYSIADSNDLTYYKSFPRVSGRALSVAWSPDAKYIYSGSSDGFIHCWDAKQGHEIYRITAGRGNLSSGSELCIWSLLALSSGTLVSGDSSGSVQFWDCQHGTLLQAHSLHKGDVNALAAVPTDNKVFSAGSDGQVILYKLSTNTVESTDAKSPFVVIKKWVYVGYVRAHTHDVRALAVAMPISREEAIPDENIKRVRRKKKPIDFSYHKWAHLGFPMLISAGDDTKLFAYSAKKFTQFSPHDICPAPQRVPTRLVLNTVFNKYALLLVQSSFSVDILRLRIENGSAQDIGSSPAPSVGLATTNLLARVKSKGSQKIICSTMSSSGELFAYSDNKKLSLFELKKSEVGKKAWAVNKQQLPKKLPFAHCMVFSPDSSYLMIAGHDRRIYVVNLKKSEMVYTLTPCRDKKMPSRESPITKLFISSDGQWLAAINCFGDMHIFNLEIQRQHWYISRLDGASVNAGGFSPHNNNMLVVSTSLNQVYVFDVETKQLGEWSMRHTCTLPRRYQELPGEVIGLSFSPTNSSSAIIYSARGMCVINFDIPDDLDDNNDGVVLDTVSNKLQQCSILKRKLRDCDIHTKIDHRENSDFRVFRDPVLFVGHLSENSIFVINKPWTEVVRTFDAPPVHRHIYGT